MGLQAQSASRLAVTAASEVHAQSLVFPLSWLCHEAVWRELAGASWDSCAGLGQARLGWAGVWVWQGTDGELGPVGGLVAGPDTPTNPQGHGGLRPSSWPCRALL